MTAPATPLAFQEKTLLVYPPVGLVRFEGLSTAEDPGTGAASFFLRLSPQIGTICTDLLIPATLATKNGLRSLGDLAAVQACYDILQQEKTALHKMGKKATINSANWYARLHTGVMADQARVLRDFARTQGDPSPTEAEKALTRKARQLLAAEIGAILHLDPLVVQEDIDSLLKAPRQGKAPPSDYSQIPVVTRHPAPYDTTPPYQRIRQLTHSEIELYRRNTLPKSRPKKHVLGS